MLTEMVQFNHAVSNGDRELELTPVQSVQVEPNPRSDKKRPITA